MVLLKSLCLRKRLDQIIRKLVRQTLGAYSIYPYTAGWRRSRLMQTCRPGHLFPNSSNLSNQPNPLPFKFPCLCMQCTPINTHSGMPTYYGGPLRHSGSATVVTRQFRVTARYCFLSLVRPLLVLDGDGGSYPCSWPIVHGQKTKTIIVSLSSYSRGRVFV